MNVSELNSAVLGYTTGKSEKSQTTGAAKEAQTETAAQQTESAVPERKDGFVYSATSKPVTYGKRLSSDQMMDMERQRMDSFTRMLQSMVTKQGQKSNLNLFGLDLTVSRADSNAAAASIAPGGEYSVDAVAGRILDMAKALSGGDPSKISELRTAVQKGFKAAGVDLGGKLPSICNDTYDKVMKDFDEWEKSYATAE